MKQALGFIPQDISQSPTDCSREFFLKRLESQFYFFNSYGVPGFSLKGQIHKQLNNIFLKPSRTFEGIVCIGYTDVLVHISQTNTNGASIERWRYFLNMLREKGFMLVLIRDAAPVLSEDQNFDKIINKDLGNFFHCKFFLGNLVKKVNFIDYIKYFAQTQNVPFLVPSFLFLFDQERFLTNARNFNIITFTSVSALPLSEAPFFTNTVNYFNDFPLRKASSVVPLVSDPPSQSIPSDMLSFDPLIQQESLAEDSSHISAAFLQERLHTPLYEEEISEFRSIWAKERSEQHAIERRIAQKRADELQKIQWENFFIEQKNLQLSQAQKEHTKYLSGLEDFKIPL